MAIVQALLALIIRSAGRIVNALFGWAVRALFGQTSSREQTALSGVVALAVAWPILLLGLLVPSVAARLLAFMPGRAWLPPFAGRVIWLALAIAVPTIVGAILASRSPPGSPAEPFARRVLRGFPITVGLAGAFLLMLLSLPIVRFAALVRQRKSAGVPLITDAIAYRDVAGAFRDVLERHGLALQRAEPDWWVRAPLRVLLWFGGDAFRAYLPRELEHFWSPDLVMSLYSGGVLLRGSGRNVAAAQALIVEAIIETNGLETVDPLAQKLERQIHDIWKACVLAGPARAAAEAPADLAAVARELASLELDLEQWRALYRQLLQVDRSLRGDPQLMEAEVASSRARFAEEAATEPKIYLSELAELAELAEPAELAELAETELARVP
jgi:hypothetical protein